MLVTKTCVKHWTKCSQNRVLNTSFVNHKTHVKHVSCVLGLLMNIETKLVSQKLEKKIPTGGYKMGKIACPKLFVSPPAPPPPPLQDRVKLFTHTSILI